MIIMNFFLESWKGCHNTNIFAITTMSMGIWKKKNDVT